MERQRWFLWLFPVLIVLWSVSGFAHRDDLFGKLEMAVLYLLGPPFMLRQRRRAIDRTRCAFDRAQPS